MTALAKFDGITGQTDAQGDLSLAVRGPLSRVQLNGQTFIEGPEGQLLGPISGEGVFKPQGVDEQGSVIVGDNHFSQGVDAFALLVRGPLSEVQPEASTEAQAIWTNGGASTFEDRVESDLDANDAVFAMVQSDGFMKLGDIKGEFQASTREKGWWTVDGADFRENESTVNAIDSFAPMEAMRSVGAFMGTAPEAESSEQRQIAALELGQPTEPQLMLPALI